MTGYYASAVVGSESARCTLANEFELADRIEEEPFKSIYLPEYRERPWYSPFDFRRALYSEFMQYPDSQKVDPRDPKFDPGVVATNVMWMESVCLATQMKYGFHGLFGNGVLNSALELGPTKHNYHVWIDRIKGEFDPKNLANPPTLRMIDALLHQSPWLLTEEYRQIQNKIAASGWKEE